MMIMSHLPPLRPLSRAPPASPSPVAPTCRLSVPCRAHLPPLRPLSRAPPPPLHCGAKEEIHLPHNNWKRLNIQIKRIRVYLFVNNVLYKCCIDKINKKK